MKHAFPRIIQEVGFDFSWDVIDHPHDFSAEYDRTMAADTSHPIDIMFWRGR
jgi:hypothetical protein